VTLIVSLSRRAVTLYKSLPAMIAPLFLTIPH